MVGNVISLGSVQREEPLVTVYTHEGNPTTFSVSVHTQLTVGEISEVIALLGQFILSESDKPINPVISEQKEGCCCRNA